MKATLSVLAAAVTLAACISISMVSADDTQAEAPETVPELLQQRRQTLRQLVKLRTEEYRDGIIGYDAVIDASDELIAAELELAAGEQEKIALLERRVELMKSLLALSESRFASGQVRHGDVLSSRVALLEARIQLARERPAVGE